MNAKKSKIVCFAVVGVIMAILLAVNIVCAAMSTIITEWLCGYANGSEGDSVASARGEALAEQIQGEGTVLIQNNDNLLPLDKDTVTQVNVFGWASTDWVYSGSGSGQVINATKDLLVALEEYGISYNTELTDMYNRFQGARQFTSAGALHAFNYEFSRLYEPNIDDTAYYTDSMLSNAEAYSDTAIVVIGRISGESNDSPKVQYKKNSSSNTIVEDATRTYLEISTEEEALLEYVGETYENVIVLINSTNVMELGFMETIPGLDAGMIVATTGTTAATAIPKLLYGEITPSGKTADTYAYDLSTSSTYTDTGSGNDTTNFYTNGNGMYPADGTQHTNGSTNVPYTGVAYTDLREGIYVGYKWYETADAEGYWTSLGGYDNVVQYPFGFGLSYTQFTWEVLTITPQNHATLDKLGTISVYVKVTNVGTVAGQDVVQLYYTPVYTKGEIEKASVNLCAFAKTTEVLEPNEYQIVEMTLDVEDMKSYDYNDANNNGFNGYELEAGAYTLTLRTDAHTLAGEKIVTTAESGHNSDTITYNVAADTTYEYDLDKITDANGNVTNVESDRAVGNLFTGEDAIDGVAIDGNSDGTAEITYLSRNDFAGTFPAEQAANRTMTEDVATYNLYTEEMANEWASERSDAEDIVTGDSSKGDNVVKTVEGKITLTEIGRTIGSDYDAEEWEDVLDRITLAEMEYLVLHGYVHTRAIASVGKPETRDLDGPNQIGSFASERNVTGFSSITLAQTWNVKLAYDMALTIASEAAGKGISGWYGPGVNLHRSPFGGRNFEYYSEDAYLSGIMCSYAVTAAKNAGVYSYLKHLCLYEMESGRDGMYNWLTEQALREIYVKPFEICIKDGGATGIMTSYGRIGAVWTGGSEALLTNLVRGEWNYHGAFLTDYADHHAFMNGDQMIRAGGDLWMDGYSNNGKFDFETTSNAMQQQLRFATKNVLYMYLDALVANEEYNEAIANGENPDGFVIITQAPKLNFAWWIPVLIVVDVLAVAGCAVWVLLTLRKKG